MIQYLWDFWHYLEVEVIRIATFNPLSDMGARFLRCAHVLFIDKHWVCS
jgi:hypothetical protein